MTDEQFGEVVVKKYSPQKGDVLFFSFKGAEISEDALIGFRKNLERVLGDGVNVACLSLPDGGSLNITATRKEDIECEILSNVLGGK